MSEEKIKAMAEFKENVLNYLRKQQSIVTNALNAYDNDAIKDDDKDIRKMRETEAIKLRDRQMQLDMHISVIELM